MIINNKNCYKKGIEKRKNANKIIDNKIIL